MTGLELIEAERARQIEVEGFDNIHDSQHTAGDLKVAAMCYVITDDENTPQPAEWRFSPDWWKPKDRIRNLVKAGALYLAAADRAAKDKDFYRIHLFEASLLKGEARECGKLIDRIQRGGWQVSEKKCPCGNEVLETSGEDAGSCIGSCPDPNDKGIPLRIVSGTLTPEDPQYLVMLTPYDKDDVVSRATFYHLVGHMHIKDCDDARMSIEALARLHNVRIVWMN